MGQFGYSSNFTVGDRTYLCTVINGEWFGTAGRAKLLDADRNRVFLNLTIEDVQRVGGGTDAQGAYYLGSNRFELATKVVSAENDRQVQFKFNTYAELMQQELWIEGLGGATVEFGCIAVACICSDTPDLECKCDMPYGFNQASVTISAGGFPSVKLFGANKNRVTLIITCGDTATSSLLVIGVSGPFSTTSSILENANPCNLVLPYRDWGPVIQEEIWIAGNVVSQGKVVNGTEIYKVPSG